MEKNEIKAQIVFLGGIHGAGKTFLFNQKNCSRLDLEYISASSILKWEKKSKRVDSIKDNQALLLQGLGKLELNKKYLLDGHFCLLNKNKEIEKIKFEVFEKINPKSIILIYDELEVIQERLLKRDLIKYSLYELKELQDSEIESAEEIASKLKIRLHILKNSEFEKYFDEIKEDLK